MSLASTPGFAQALFYGQLTMPVNAVSGTKFEVIQTDGIGPLEIWCAAGYYASKRLGKTRGRVFIDRPLGAALTAPGRKGVVFTINAPAQAESSGRTSLTIEDPGASLLINHALQFCKGQDVTAGA